MTCEVILANWTQTKLQRMKMVLKNEKDYIVITFFFFFKHHAFWKSLFYFGVVSSSSFRGRIFGWIIFKKTNKQKNKSRLTLWEQEASKGIMDTSDGHFSRAGLFPVNHKWQAAWLHSRRKVQTKHLHDAMHRGWCGTFILDLCNTFSSRTLALKRAPSGAIVDETILFNCLTWWSGWNSQQSTLL